MRRNILRSRRHCIRNALGSLMLAVAGLSSAIAPVHAGTKPAQEDIRALIARCAPTVDLDTMTAVIAAESKGRQFAIADAGPVKLPWSERKLLVRSFFEDNLEAAVTRANTLIANGHTVSLGLAQINDRNLASLGLTVREVFEPCTNVAAGAKILTAFYSKAANTFGPGERALRAALSAYNSGDFYRGERDGYVHTVYRMAGRVLPQPEGLAVPSISRLEPAVNLARADASPGERSFTMSRTPFPETP